MSGIYTPRTDNSTPSSEQSVYFDAPIMHISSKIDVNDDDDRFVAPPVNEKNPATRNTLMYDYSNSQLRPKNSSVAAGEATQGSRPEHANAQDAAYTTAKDDSTRRRKDTVPNANADHSDSGYSSSSPRNRPRSMSAQRFKPVPVVWSGQGQDHTEEGEYGEDDRQTPQPQTRKQTQELAGGVQRPGIGEPRRSQSLRSFRPATATDHYDRDTGSGRATLTGRRSVRRRISLNGGSFANGAGMIGPNAQPKEEETSVFRSRSINADAGLTKKQKLRIGKNELKEAKSIVKVMKQEAKAEQKALGVSVKELADIQRLQKNAIKEEAKANAAYANALRIFHKEELEYLAACAKYERAQADLQAYENAREAAREHAREATEMLQEKNREIEWLRAQKAADDREREAKIRQLSGKAP